MSVMDLIWTEAAVLVNRHAAKWFDGTKQTTKNPSNV